MFLDQVKIWVHGGNGSDGAASFRREAHVPRGGPDGGDGGRGGSICLTVDPGETSLRDFRHAHHFKGEAGGRGAGQRKHGKAGDDLVLKVPPGTVVFEDPSGELLGDLVASEQNLMVARGGRGGLGNVHFATSTHQAPLHAQKSADYPFTTLEPNLGVLDMGDVDSRRPTIADVPGLIEGASSGAGLGHAFLRHVERTGILVHVVDGSDRDPEWSFGVIRDELEAHDPKLLAKPTLVVFNKMDRPEASEAWVAFEKARRAQGLPTVAISAVSGEGLEAFRSQLSAMLPTAEELAEPPASEGVVIHRIESMSDSFKVTRDEDGIFVVRGRRIERVASQTNFDVEESADRFQADLTRLGIDAELRRQGVAPGDAVRIAAVELEWGPDEWQER